MDEKTENLKKLKDMYAGWERLLNSLSEDQIISGNFIADRSIKDIVGHLTAWQQVSVARLSAAISGTVPVMPGWFGGSDPESDENLDEYNENIHLIYRDKDWSDVHREWKERYQELLELAEEVPSGDMQDVSKYPWMYGYALIDVLHGTYEHHREHIESVRDTLHRAGK